MSYKTNFTITPPCEWMKSAYLRPVDVIGKIDDGHRCCVISRGDFWIAKHKGGSFFSSGLSKRLPAVTEATPIPTESQWPKGCEWSEDDWTERGIHPPRPVQDAILIDVWRRPTITMLAPLTFVTRKKLTLVWS